MASGIVAIPWDIAPDSGILQYSSGDKFRIHDFCEGILRRTTMLHAGDGRRSVLDDRRSPRGEELPGHGQVQRVGVIVEAFNIFDGERYQNFQDFNGARGEPQPRQADVDRQRIAAALSVRTFDSDSDETDSSRRY